MGIWTRQRGENFVITSDHSVDASANRRAPTRISEVYQVWSGQSWSESMTDALAFDSLDAADDYVRVHYAALSRAAGAK